jgi:PAS domain S-box-containing protein
LKQNVGGAANPVMHTSKPAACGLNNVKRRYPRPVKMNLDPSEIALSVTNHISAMVAYWNAEQRCVFSNDAYREWFGKSPEQMKGMAMKDLLGPLYELNLPFILAALKGEKQVFERRIPLPGGGVRESIATYTPDVVDGVVRGFSVHVADVTPLREREAALERAVRERDAALVEVKTLRGLLPTCAFCKSIRDQNGEWLPMEVYIGKHSQAEFSHGLCPKCGKKHYAEFFPEDGSA